METVIAINKENIKTLKPDWAGLGLERIESEIRSFRLNKKFATKDVALIKKTVKKFKSAEKEALRYFEKQVRTKKTDSCEIKNVVIDFWAFRTPGKKVRFKTLFGVYQFTTTQTDELDRIKNLQIGDIL